MLSFSTSIFGIERESTDNYLNKDVCEDWCLDFCDVEKVYDEKDRCLLAFKDCCEDSGGVAYGICGCKIDMNKGIK
jgi:hypothetical protein